MIGPPKVFSIYVVQRQCLTVNSFDDLLIVSMTVNSFDDLLIVSTTLIIC